MARAREHDSPDYRNGYKAGYAKAKYEVEKKINADKSIKAKARWVLKDRDWFCSKCKTKCEQNHYDFCCKCGSPMMTVEDEDGKDED